MHLQGFCAKKIIQCYIVVSATFEKDSSKIFVLGIFIRLTCKTLLKQYDYDKKEDKLVLHCNLFNVKNSQIP